ncbi:MAG: cardiolipin synthase [Clostridiales bacterium]|nr:cardiolipin synthase [Clostridiales bacterium]
MEQHSNPTEHNSGPREGRSRRWRRGVKGVRIELSTVIRRVIFSRTLVALLLLLAQVVILLIPAYRMTGFSLLAAVAILFIVNREENPDFKLAWVLPIAVLPVFGVLLYLVLKLQPSACLVSRRARQLDRVAVDTGVEGPDGVCRYLAKLNYPTYDDTAVHYFPLGELMFEEMLRQMETAEEFLFIESFIVAEGVMWEEVKQLLKRKAAQGVEVRLMVDGLGSLGKLPKTHLEELERAGVRCKVFAPLHPVLSTLQNNRDHRKILVVDGRVGFTGGINIADEYINIALPHHWKDTGVLLEGGAVNSLTLMFLRTWALYDPGGGKNMLCYLRHHRAPRDGFVVPYADSPFDEEDTGKRVYLDMIHTAQRYVHIMTPYLIIDSELSQGLRYAAKRGVDVSLILPAISDNWVASTVGRTYYRELICDGVKIYEYEPGMMHGKSFVVDDNRAVVGTINIDYRSLFLHLECGCYLLDASAVTAVEEDFQICLEWCRRIGPQDIDIYSLPRRLIGQVGRLFAPLL